MKIWGTRFRAWAKDFSTLRCTPSISRNLGRNRIETLMHGLTVLLDGLGC